MKKMILALFTFVFIFGFHLQALADEGHSHESNIKEATEKFRSGADNKPEDGNVEHGHSDESDSTHDTNVDIKSHGNEGGGHADGSHDTTSNHSGESGGHHGPVVETPPNYKILGTYGAVNLSFILMGVWNKWFRRKEK